MTFAFLGYHESVGRWLLVTDRVPTQIINWVIGVTLTFGLLRGIVIPYVRRLKAEWRAHRAAQVQIAASNDKIADLLSTSTPGGLKDVVDAVNRRQW
jgi:hypothetical protein